MDNGQAPMTDWELARRARRGDSRAFHDLMDRHAPYLYGLAVKLVGNAADAEDVLQETFAGAFRGLDSFRHEAALKTWLTQILVRQVARHRRDQVRRPVVRLNRSQDPPAAGRNDRSDIRMDFGSALEALEPEYREVVVLRELEAMSYEQIATVLGVPRGTVESRLFRARRRLQELLKDYRP